MVKEWKIKEVENIAEMISNYPVVGIVSLYKIPTSALQKIKNELKGKAKIKVSKKSILIRALEKKGIKELEKFMEGQIGLILTDMNPYKLLFYLQKKTTNAPAKPGDVAEDDIVVPAGPTEIPAGPAISTLTKVKIPAKVEGGKIAIQKDTVVAKKGDVISEDLAAALNLLKIEPMKIGLKLLGVWENGKVYGGDQLDVTEDEIIENLNSAYSTAVKLSIGLGFPTKETIELLLQKAYMNAKALSEEVGEVK